MEQLRIEYVHTSTLHPYEKNTRKHEKLDVDNIARSIEKYGMNDAIGVWGENNTIVEGHGRWLACKKLGIEMVPIIRLDHLSDEERREYGIAHNATAELSVWDPLFLAEELKDLDLGDFDFDFGLDLEAEEAKEIVEDEAPEVDDKGEPIAKLGDIWQLGRHRLMCGDSTSVEDVEKLMDGELADLLITDPPYNVALGMGESKEVARKRKRRIDGLVVKNDRMEDSEFRQFLANAFFAADNVMKPGAVFYIWHADKEGYNFMGACVDIGWKVRQCIIWNKNIMILGRQDYQQKHEPCLYGWKEGAGHLWASDRKQTTVINWDKPAKSEIHPTMKPVGLFDYQIKNNTKGGDVVLDLFNGSGTTIMACEQNGRIAYAMELDPRYVDAAIKRWEIFTGETARKIN